MHAFCDLESSSMQLERRAARRQVRYFKVFPPDAAAPTGANRLHRGFLGRKASRVALIAVPFALGVGDLGGRIDALQKAQSKTFNCFPNAIHLRHIDADPDDHSSAPVALTVS